MNSNKPSHLYWTVSSTAFTFFVIISVSLLVFILPGYFLALVHVITTEVKGEVPQWLIDDIIIGSSFVGISFLAVLSGLIGCIFLLARKKHAIFCLTVFSVLMSAIVLFQGLLSLLPNPDPVVNMLGGLAMLALAVFLMTFARRASLKRWLV